MAGSDPEALAEGFRINSNYVWDGRRGDCPVCGENGETNEAVEPEPSLRPVRLTGLSVSSTTNHPL